MLVLVKMNLRLDEHYNYEDELLEHYINTAKEYFKEATGHEFDKKKNIHKNIILLLTSHWYENRNIAITSDLDRTLTSMFLMAGLQRIDKND